MPSVLDAPESSERIAHLDVPDLYLAKPSTPRSRPGFWRTLVCGMTTHLIHTPRVQQAPSYSSHRPFETPMDRVAREQPWLSILALTIT